jgi:hypothetical protein
MELGFDVMLNAKARSMQLTAVYMQVPEGYIAFVEELPGANTQGATLEEAREKSLVGQAVVREPFEFATP